jgi:hypothetical protein
MELTQGTDFDKYLVSKKQAFNKKNHSIEIDFKVLKVIVVNPSESFFKFSKYGQRIFIEAIMMKADPTGRVYPRPLPCWNCWFESCRKHGCLSLASKLTVCFQVEVSTTGRSIVQRSPTECVVSECDRGNLQRRSKPTGTASPLKNLRRTLGHNNYRSLTYYKSRNRVVLGALSRFERTQLKILRLWKVSLL